MTKEKSEYGKGLVICLVKFANHFNNDQAKTIYDLKHYYDSDEKVRKEMLKYSPEPSCNYGKRFHDKIRFYIRDMLPIHNGNLDELISHEITLWANGATDHLYEIEVPKGKSWDKIRTKIEKLQDEGLQMGHGFRENKLYTPDDMKKLINLTIEISVMIDKKLGLKSDRGEWM